MAIPMAVGSTVDVVTYSPVTNSYTGDSGTVVALTANYLEMTTSDTVNPVDRVYPWPSIQYITVMS